jgi:hypothetical protein
VIRANKTATAPTSRYVITSLLGYETPLMRLCSGVSKISPSEDTMIAQNIVPTSPKLSEDEFVTAEVPGNGGSFVSGEFLCTDALLGDSCTNQHLAHASDHPWRASIVVDRNAQVGDPFRKRAD